MLIRTGRDGFLHPTPSEITPEAAYRQRRQLLRLMASGAAGAALAGWAGRQALADVQRPGKLAALPAVKSSVPGAVTMEKITAYKDATGYNNFYEFGTDKSDPAENAHTLKTTPWTVEVEGLVKKPAKYALEDLLKNPEKRKAMGRAAQGRAWSEYSVDAWMKKHLALYQEILAPAVEGA